MKNLPGETSEKALFYWPDDQCEKGFFFLAVIDIFGHEIAGK
jgi:hypothetical protein